jgi:hypothetical protein
MPQNGTWGKWTQLLTGLPYDVQARLYYVLQNYEGVNPSTCYRLPFLSSTQRQAINPGAAAADQWRFSTLSCVFAISQTFENEVVQAAAVTAGVSGLTAVYPSEVTIQIGFNNNATTLFGTGQEPCSLGSLGDRNFPSRIDPITSVRNDVWNITWTGTAGLLNQVFSTVTLHGVKIFAASGAI